ncbi:MAG: ABC transporter ATP-binding protein [Thermoplasmata archaeon]
MTGLEVGSLRGERGPFAVGPIDMEARPGEALALVGPSGAGKTTLLRLLAGFLTARSGSIKIDGRDVTRSHPEERNTGYVPQGLGLFPHRTVASNVAYPLELRGERDCRRQVDEILDRWGLTTRSEAMPDRLSSGEQQRVAMARALAARPRLLLWDEPLGALDLMARESLMGTIREALEVEGVPMVIVTHDPDTAFSLADRFLLLDGGRMVFSGSGPDLGRSPPNPFAARFAGYLNVLTSIEVQKLVEADPGSSLREFADGPGICFDPSAVQMTGPDTGGMTARVRRRRYSPLGPLLTLDVAGIEVALRVPPSISGERAPAVGDRIRIAFDPARIRPVVNPQKGALDGG